MNPFEELLVSLVDGDVRFVTVGGLACAFNGHVRATQDVDILVSADRQNLERLLAVLGRFGEGHANELTPDDFPVELGAVRIHEAFPLDVFTLMMDLTYEDLLPHVRVHSLSNRDVPYLDARGLIRLKAPSARERDRFDVLALQELTEREAD